MIAGRLPGRTDNEIKNYWNTHIRRKLLSRGVDPATHLPLNQEHLFLSISGVPASISDEEEVKKKQMREQIPSLSFRDFDLNLDLCISPPSLPQEQGSAKRGG